jgi:hypothetical protein
LWRLRLDSALGSRRLDALIDQLGGVAQVAMAIIHQS